MNKEMPWRVLCVDDDPALAEQAADYLRRWKKDNPWGEFECEVESSFAAAIDRLERERFDLITLDLHGPEDTPPKEEAEFGLQQGERVLKSLRSSRFIPVIFITGYADKVAGVASAVVKVVKKGEDEIQRVRASARELYATGLPSLMRSIDEVERNYLWDTVAEQWAGFSEESDVEELSHLLARRLAAHLASFASCSGKMSKAARAVEYYLYPVLAEKVDAGNIYQIDGYYWIVITPACDLATQSSGQRKAESVILTRACALTDDPRHKAWATSKWLPGEEVDKAGSKAHERLSRLIKDNDGDRWRFLPGTFFIPDLVADFQQLKHMAYDDLSKLEAICCLDSPFRQEFLLRFSRYYGRLGTPDIDVGAVFHRLKA